MGRVQMQPGTPGEAMNLLCRCLSGATRMVGGRLRIDDRYIAVEKDHQYGLAIVHDEDGGFHEVVVERIPVAPRQEKRDGE